MNGFQKVLCALALIFSLNVQAADEIRFDKLGFYRVKGISPEVHLGNPLRNAEEVIKAYKAEPQGTSVLAFPELNITGYSVKDLFLNEELLDLSRLALTNIVEATFERNTEKPTSLVIVGAPYSTPDGRLFNVAFVIYKGKVVGAIPKTYLPNYAEFEEARWFESGHNVNMQINDPILGKFTLSSKQIFTLGDLRVGVEICEDAWTPNPPSTELYLAGANLVVNLSASNNLVGKNAYRRDLIKSISARNIGAYLYVSAGPTESTDDLVFDGHKMIAEDGALLAESHSRLKETSSEISLEIDVSKINHERRRNRSWGHSIAVNKPSATVTALSVRAPILTSLQRKINPHPFVPSNPAQLESVANEVLDIQATGLARRILSLQKGNPSKIHHMIIGVSGGLDSTLALLVAHKACEILEVDPSEYIVGITMPGFGTSTQTRSSADDLMEALKIQTRVIPIADTVMSHFKDIGHDPSVHNTTYENAQARERTQILFDVANQMSGIVVGTGNLSEICLGWCTYNGDHMSNYNVNASVPKTLVKGLVRYVANTTPNADLSDVLKRILDTKVSPELKPTNADGTIAQVTEDEIGPYELHDFFIFHFLRNGFSKEKIFSLAQVAFQGMYEKEVISRWLDSFYTRFLINHFKRSTAAPGPKTGSVSASPRGDLRLPPELEKNCMWWLKK